MPVLIPEQYFPLFRRAGEVRHLPKHTMIFSQGDFATDLYLLTQGRAKVFLLSPNGRSITFELLKKGRIFGDASFLSHAQRKVCIQTLEATEVVVLDPKASLPLFQNSTELMTLMFQHMTQSCNDLTHQINRLVCYDSRQKLADFLLCQSGEENSGVLSLTHENIAECIGLNRVTVSRLLRSFAKAGWVRTQYGKISVLRPDCLSALLFVK